MVQQCGGLLQVCRVKATQQRAGRVWCKACYRYCVRVTEGGEKNRGHTAGYIGREVATTWCCCRVATLEVNNGQVPTTHHLLHMVNGPAIVYSKTISDYITDNLVSLKW